MILNLEKFIGKVAVVTGASAGIGHSVVDELVKHGVIVAGLSRRVKRMEKHAAILAEEPGKLYAFKCDITKEEEIVSTIKRIIKDLGNIHILVNNAGMSLSTAIMDGDLEMWKTMIDTNVLGLCIASREVLANMKENGTKGHIININSIAGHNVVPIPNLNMYIATKFAVTALTKTMKIDVAAANLPIKITSISPGYVKTEFFATAGIPDEILFTMNGLSGEDIAEAVIYALSTGPGVNIDELTITPL